ncbi:glycosyltransferase family 1 protein [Salinibacterium sp. ZJ77]|uniref:glycosyltransferase family 4 protein n=1 Tax=Salinibacterium sp. ZJ77 TaxID=2708337 RepID=UPI001423FE54|nr:glycosyltransferase family 1 protein [Salinibacterium sp. ZJ77]
MTTLRVTLDALADSPAGGASRYAGELARGLIATAPDGAVVIGVVPSSPQAACDRIESKLPGLARLEKSVLAQRELEALWRAGFGRSAGAGMMHATSLLAPLGPHDRVHRPSDQVAVTIHDAIAWTHPELVPARRGAWIRAMARRAERHADAVVVPSHSVADALAGHIAIGDRIRVIPGAPSPSLIPGDDAEARRQKLDLPDRYVLTIAGDPARNDLASLVDAAGVAGMPLVIAGAVPPELREHVERTPTADVRLLGNLHDTDLGVVYHHAHAYVQPSIAAGLGLAVIEALGFGLPVIHTDLPVLEEITADAALIVPLEGEGFASRLAEAIRSLDDPTTEQLSIASGDRARAFSWRDSAAKVWQLHADL